MGRSISPSDVRFIKLGRGGEWERSSIEEHQVIRLGYVSDLHDECLAGDWPKVSKHWLGKRKGTKSTATSDIRQIRDFYEKSATTLWFTFFGRMLWWSFAKERVQLLDDGSRVRAVIGKWKCVDSAGRPLSIETLDGRLTKVGMYRGTICEVKPLVAEYLVRRINGNHPPEVQQAQDAMVQLQKATEVLIKGLYWKDFELLTDLLFSRAGYRRLDVLGKTAKAIDLDLEAPVTQRKAFVQVKSSGSRAALEESIANFKEMPQYDEFFFICHSGKQLLNYEADDPNIRVLTGATLAKLVVNAGLVEWLIGKRS